GTMVPYVLVADVTLPGSRMIILPLAIYMGMSVAIIGLAWAVPFALAAVGAVAFLLYLTVKSEQLASGRGGARPTHRPRPEIAREFWRFAAARSLAGPLQAALVSLDLILLGSLRSASEAAVYSAAGRFAFIGR